jgi:hypothetical protein
MRELVGPSEGRPSPLVALVSAGTSQRSDGYRLVYAPDHPAAHKKGWVYEHRLVAEEMIGRPLRSDEHVHHINEDPSDNRAENLEVLTIREHRRRHGNTTLTDEDR